VAAEGGHHATNWHEATTVHHVDRFDVEKTETRFFYSNCEWTSEKLQAAIVPLAEKATEKVSNLRVTSLSRIDEIKRGDERWHRTVDLDKELGI
jgi:hypothetical protein